MPQDVHERGELDYHQHYRCGHHRPREQYDHVGFRVVEERNQQVINLDRQRVRQVQRLRHRVRRTFRAQRARVEPLEVADQREKPFAPLGGKQHAQHRYEKFEKHFESFHLQRHNARVRLYTFFFLFGFAERNITSGSDRCITLIRCLRFKRMFPV